MRSINLVYLVLVIVAVLMWTHRKESYETKVDESKCQKMAAKNLWGEYDWTQRIMNKGAWKCPSGWQNTGCTWNMNLSREFQSKQCRRKKSGGGETKEEKDAERSSATRGLIASIRIYTAQIKRLGGTPKGSNRVASANVSETALMARVAELKKQYDELAKNQPAGASGEASGEDASKSTYLDAIAVARAEITKLGGTPKGSGQHLANLSADQLKDRLKSLNTQLGNLKTRSSKDKTRMGLLSSIEIISNEIANAGGSVPGRASYETKPVPTLQRVFAKYQKTLADLKQTQPRAAGSPLAMADAAQLGAQTVQSEKGAPFIVSSDGKKTYVGNDKVDWTKYGCNTEGLGPGEVYTAIYKVTDGQCYQNKQDWTGDNYSKFPLCECAEGTETFPAKTIPANKSAHPGDRWITFCKNSGKCKS